MAHPRLITVVDRLGISPGVGDGSIGSICSARGIDCAFLLAVVNTFIDRDYFPSETGTFATGPTVDYLRKTAAYYRHVQIPNILRHFDKLMAKSGTDNNLPMLREFLDGAVRQLEGCLGNDERLLQAATSPGADGTDARELVEAHSEVEEKLHDVLWFFIVHLHGDYDRNLCMAVVSAVSALYDDYVQNNRIRSRILIPTVCCKDARP